MRRGKAEEPMSWVVVRRRAGETIRRARVWLAAEWMKSHECRDCGKPVGMFEKVCNQCGCAEPAQFSRGLVAVMAGVGVPLILVVLLLA
ncbi:MAG: hypothetical protein WD875_13690 [Pirellulales bacterium]